MVRVLGVYVFRSAATGESRYEATSRGRSSSKVEGGEVEGENKGGNAWIRWRVVMDDDVEQAKIVVQEKGLPEEGHPVRLDRLDTVAAQATLRRQ